MSSTLAFPVKTLTPTDSLVGFQGTTPGDERTFVPGAAGALVFSGATAAAIRTTLELGNVNNTSDASKPVSTATQTALNAKLTAASNLSDLTSASTARTNLGLGTAATRTVGQSAGNVLELSALNAVTIGDGSSPSGLISLKGPDGIVFVKNEDGLLTFIDYTGTATLEQLARLSQLPTFGTGVATALAVNLGTTGSPALRLIQSDTTPASPNAMDEWYDSATGARYVRYGSQWVEVSGSTIGNALATTTSAGMVQGVGIALPQAPVGTNVAYISQLGAIGRNFSSFLYTDFLTGGFSGSVRSASDGVIFGTGQSGTGASVGKLNTNVSGRAGILVLTTGTTATGYAAIDTWGTSNTYRYDDGQTVFETSVRLPVLSDATNEYSFSVGGAVQNNGIGNDGAFFTYNRASLGANWQAASRLSGSQTTSNSNVAVVANTWVRLALIVNATGTSITYYIDGVLVATITTNIQAAGAGREGCLLVKSAGTTSVTANIDYYFLGKTFTNPR